MKKDLKSFMKGKGKEDVPPDVKQDIEKKAAKYQGKSEDELMRELSKEIAKGKQEGSFTKENRLAYAQQRTKEKAGRHNASDEGG